MRRSDRRVVVVKDYERPRTFILCLLERMEEDPDGMIAVYRLSDDVHELPRHMGFISLAEAYACEVESRDHIENLLRDFFGGGDYRLRFTDPGGRVLAWYDFGVAGPEGGSRWKPDGGELDEDELIMKVVARAVIENNSLRQFCELARLIRELNAKR